MILIGIVKRMLKHFINRCLEYYHLAKLEQKYPDCSFYEHSNITNSTFGNYNIVNRNVIIDSSAIGSHTYIQKFSTIFNAEIGRFCSIASGVSIGPGIHKTDGISTHPAFYLKNTALNKTYSKTDAFPSSKRTFIGNDVWIGERAILIDGIHVGNGAIIAAGAVVTKDVAAYSIVGGTPAKLIRIRFDQTIVDQIDASEWWNNTEEWFEKNYSTFADQKTFLKNLKEDN